MTSEDLAVRVEAKEILLREMEGFSPHQRVLFLNAFTEVGRKLQEQAEEEALEADVEEKARQIAGTSWHKGTRHNERILRRALELLQETAKQETTKQVLDTKSPIVERPAIKQKHVALVEP